MRNCQNRAGISVCAITLKENQTDFSTEMRCLASVLRRTEGVPRQSRDLLLGTRQEPLIGLAQHMQMQ